MTKKLVAYFSASGITRKAAEIVAKETGADLFEIKPTVPYTKEDLDWRNKSSRSSVEMNDLAFRPPMVENAPDLSAYDTVYLGFPIWWYIAPTICNTFLESGDFSGKSIVLFATAGSSGFGKTVENLLPSCPGANLSEGKRFLSNFSEKEVVTWAKTL